jgi:hypothetical protein
VYEAFSPEEARRLLSKLEIHYTPKHGSWLDMAEIELLFPPSYSPNLNLIERFWKYVKKKCLYCRYYPAFAEFKQAIDACIHTGSTATPGRTASVVDAALAKLRGGR